MSDPSRPHGLQPSRLLGPWHFPGKSTGVGCHCLLRQHSARRSNQSILKEISPGCSLERLMLKLKLQCFGHLMRRADSLKKTLMLGKTEKAMATHSSTLAWKIPWPGEPGRLQSTGSAKSQTQLSNFSFFPPSPTLLYVCVSTAALQIGSSVSSF